MDTGFNLDPDAYTIEELRGLLSLKEGDGLEEARAARKAIADQLSHEPGVGPDRVGAMGLFLDTVLARVGNSLGLAMGGVAPVKLVESPAGTWSQPLNPIVQQGSNVLITSPDEIAGRSASITGGRAATSGEAPPGYLNPINVRTLMQAVNVDSRFRPNYYSTKSTDFTVMLPEEIRKVVSMRVASIELPLTYYCISEAQGNAHMLLIGDSVAAAPPLPAARRAILVRVPDGNYEQSWSRKADAASIENAMNRAVVHGIAGTVNEAGLFIADSPVPPPAAPPPCAACPATPRQPVKIYAVDQASGRSLLFPTEVPLYTFADPAGLQTTTVHAVRFNIDNKGNLDTATNLQLRLGWALGFRAAEYEINQGDQKASLASEAPCNISGPRYGFLSLNDHQRNACTSFIVSYGESSLDANIITRINLTSAMGQEGAFRCAESPGLSTVLNRTREYFGPVNIQKLAVRLYDEYGRIIDLNSTDWSFNLAFEKLYD